jgi:hypothetical protein
MVKILIYFLFNLIILILLISGCFVIGLKLWLYYGVWFLVILLSIIYIMIWKDRRFNINYFTDLELLTFQKKIEPYKRIIILFYWVFHGLLYIYIIDMPLIIQDIYWLSIIMQGLFIWHVLLLNWLYALADNYKKDKIKFIISRISVLTSWVWVVIFIKQILMLIEMIIYYYEALDEKKKTLKNIKIIWKFIDIIISQIIFFLMFNISYISSVFNEYSKLLIGYKVNMKNITLISKVIIRPEISKLGMSSNLVYTIYNKSKFEKSYYYIIIGLLLWLLFIVTKPRLYMIYIIIILVNYYYIELQYKIEDYIKRNDIEIFRATWNPVSVCWYFAKQNIHIIYNWIKLDENFKGDYDGLILDYSSIVKSTTYYDSGLTLDYLVFFLDSNNHWFNLISSPVLQKFNVFDVFRFFIYDKNWRNKMVVQRYLIFDKWMFLYVSCSDLRFSGKYWHMHALMEYLIYYYRLNISVAEFSFVNSFLDLYKVDFVFEYPKELVNVENITLWKYLTKEKGYYVFDIEITDENRLKFCKYTIPSHMDLLFWDP